MKKYLLLFIPYLFILYIWGNSERIYTLLTGRENREINWTLEGAKILHHRTKMITNPEQFYNNDILLVGTSRTISDFSARIIGEELKITGTIPQEFSVFNLGNLGNYPSNLLKTFKKYNFHPKLLIIEYSPFIFNRLNPNPEENISFYKNYRRFITISEEYINGYFKELLCIDGSIKILPENLFQSFSQIKNGTFSFNSIYYLLKANRRSAQKLCDDGQVYYKYNLKDADDAISVQKLQHLDMKLELNKKKYQKYKFNRYEWDSFCELANIILEHGKMIVVRPPVNSEIYIQENNFFDSTTNMILNFLDENNIKYIDFNPNVRYFSSDYSHIDWYDTEKLSKELANKISMLYSDY